MAAGRAFDAFLSYSRQDAAFARALHKALEGFRPPAGLGRGTRRLRVFRDEGDLVGTAYFDAIDKHLASAGKLLVLCSPPARASTYVNDEIERFVRAHGPGGLIPVLVQGRANNEVTAGQADDRAFPDALCEALEMPLAVDYLGFDAQRDRVDRGRFGNAWYTLLANLYDCSREDIEQRDLRRQRRQRLVAVSTVSTVIAALSGLTIYAFHQRGVAEDNAVRAEAQQRLAEDNERRSMALLFAARSREQRGNGLPADALGWAAAAHARGPELLPTQTALVAAFYGYRAQQAAPANKLFGLDERPFSTAFSADTHRLVAGGHASVEVFDLGRGTRRALPARRVWAVDVAPDGLLALGTEQDGTYLLDPASGERTRQLDALPSASVSFSPDGRHVATAQWGGKGAALHDLEGQVHALPFGEGANRLARTGFSPDGRWAWVNRHNGSVWLWDVARGAASPVLPGRDVRDLAFDGQGRMLAATADGLWWWPDPLGEPMQWLAGQAVRHVAVTADAGTVLVLADDGQAGVWDLGTGGWRSRFRIDRRGGADLSRAHLAPDGRHALLTYGEFSDTRGELWRLAPEPQRVKSIDLRLLAVAIAFTADSQGLLMVGDRGVQRIEVGASELTATERPFTPTPPTMTLQTADGYTADAAQGTQAALTGPGSSAPRVFDAKCYITARPALSAARDRILLGTKCADARLFDAADPAGLPVLFRPRSREMAGAVALSADGRYLAVAGGADAGDRPFEVTVFAVDAPETELFAVPASDAVQMLSFADDGAELVVGTADGRETRWPLAPRIAAWVAADARFEWAREAARAPPK